jgi:hypothetical protein
MVTAHQIRELITEATMGIRGRNAATRGETVQR